jgi:hypothetical protein
MLGRARISQKEELEFCAPDRVAGRDLQRRLARSLVFQRSRFTYA